jgi:intergrase/recombinase
MDQLAILQALRREDFLQKALHQLQRDFSRIGIDFPILTSLKSFEEAEKEVQMLLDAIIHDNPESIPHILYIIDLSEIKVRQIIERSENSSADLAYAILLRSGEKVYWKERFK